MSRTTRTRLRLDLGASAFLLAAGLLPAPAHAEDVTDYSIIVAPAARSAKTMYGVFFLDLGGAKVARKARVATLAAAPGAVNTETSTAVAPVTSTFTGVSDRFTYTFPANSITFLRIRQK